MTPQERQLVDELFDRLATLENTARDPDAERAIAEGWRRAPNASYALVQSVLVQEEALKRADERISELEAQLGAAPRESGFLGSMRNMLRGESRGSVPEVRPGGMGSSGAWGAPRPEGGQPWGQQPMGQPMGGQPSAGGSFLGTAAATAAGVIGGAMLLNSIRSMMGSGQAGQTAFDDRGADSTRSPWDSGSASSGDLARDAGLGDIGSSGRGTGEERRAGLFDTASHEDSEFDDDFDGDLDGGGSDVA